MIPGKLWAAGCYRMYLLDCLGEIHFKRSSGPRIRQLEDNIQYAAMQTCACYVGFGRKAIACKGDTSAESTIGRAEWAVGEARLKPAPGSSDYFQTQSLQWGLWYPISRKRVTTCRGLVPVGGPLPGGGNQVKESVCKDSGDEQANAQWSLFEGLGERTKPFHVHHRFRDIFLLS
jgi:hypothetical protein